MYSSSFLRPACLLGTALFVASGCIPSSAPAPEAVPAPPPAPAVVEAPAPAPAEPGQASLHFDSRPVEEMNASVSMTPLPDGTGFQLSGTYGLKATLVRGATDQWVLQGTIEFPTGGYALGEPSLMPMGDVIVNGNEDVQLRQSTTHVLLQIPIQVPAADAVVTQALESAPINTVITAPHDAVFMVLLVSG